MPIVNIKIDQPVFIIEQNQILSGKIKWFLADNQFMVTINGRNHAIKKTYGVDLFFTSKKAENVLMMKTKEYKKNTKENTHTETLLSNFIQKNICNSCGIPININGYCGCN